MLRMSFDSKDWNQINDILFKEYYKNKFLYINSPELNKNRAYLLFTSIDDDQKFDEMIKTFKHRGIDVEIEIA